LDQALEQAGLAELPSATPELRNFVRTSLRPILEGELGVRLADEVARALEASLMPALRGWATLPAAPSSMKLRKAMPTAPTPTDSAPPSSQPVSVRGDGRSVLVLGHERFAAATVGRTLVGAGFKVAVALDASELGAEWSSRSFDAILTDEPRASEHAAALRELLRSAPRTALIVTGCKDPRATELLLQDDGVDQVFGLSSRASSRDVVATLARATF